MATGKAGDCPRTGRRLSRGLSRAGRCRVRAPTPGGRPRYRQAGGDPPLRGTRPRARESCGEPVLRAGQSLAVQDHRQGRSLRSRRHGDWRKRQPLSSDLPRQALGTYRKDGQGEDL